MKRIFLILTMVFSMSMLYAQPVNVTSCFNYMKYGEIENAKAAIDKAILNPKTAGLQRCWVCYGMTYKAISDSCMFNKTQKYCDMDKDALDKAFDGFIKAWILNFKDPEHQKLNHKDTTDLYKFFAIAFNPETKILDQQYQTDIYFNLAALTNAFVNKGLAQYQEGNYKGSAFTFETALILSSIQTQLDAIFEGKEPVIDAEIIYFAALANDQAKNYKKSKELLKQVISLDYGKDDTEKARMYLLKSYAEKNLGDTVGFVKTLETAMEKYPNEAFILVELINHRIERNEPAKAKDMILRAIEKDPNNKLLWFNLGTIYDNEGKREEAEKCYLKAIEIDPTYLDAIHNLGAMFVNMGVEKSEECDAIPPTETTKYKACKAQVLDLYKKALPHLEKSYELDPENVYILSYLRSIYANLQDVEKYEKIKKELEALQKK